MITEDSPGWSREQVNAHNAALYKQTRKALGATCAQLGAALGVSREMISNRENGRTEITREMMLALEMLIIMHTDPREQLKRLGMKEADAERALAQVGSSAADKARRAVAEKTEAA